MRFIGKMFTICLLFAGFNIVNPASALDILDVVAIAKGIKISANQPANQPANPSANTAFQPLSPGKSIVAPSGATPITQLWVSPLWTGTPDPKTGFLYAQCEVLPSLLASINASLSQGISINIASKMVKNSTTGFSDLYISACNRSTKALISATQICASVMPSGGMQSSNYNVTYQLSGGSAVVLGGLTTGQAFGITSPTDVVVNSAPYPTIIYNVEGAEVPLPAGVTISTFTFSPNFSDNSISEMSIAPNNLGSLTNSLDFVFAVDVILNSSGGYDGFITAYDTSSKAALFTQSFPGIINSSLATPIGANVSLTHYVVSYTLSNGTSSNPAPDISLCNGFEFKAVAAAVLPTVTTLSSQTTLSAFEGLISGGLNAINASTGTNETSPPAFIYIDIAYNGLAILSDPFLSNHPASPNLFIPSSSLPATINWANGANFVLLAFDISGNLISDLSTLASSPASLSLFVFDGVTNDQLVGSPVQVPMNIVVSPGSINPGTWALTGNKLANHMTGGILPKTPGISGTYPSVVGVNIPQSEHGNYTAFTDALGFALNNVPLTINLDNSNYPAPAITIGGYPLFGQYPQLQAYCTHANWTTGVTLVLLEFNSSGTAISSLSSATSSDSIYAFLFDTATGDPLASSGIPVAISTATPITPLAMPYSYQSPVFGGAPILITYPAAFVFTS